jgi:hypothetical protein
VLLVLVAASFNAVRLFDDEQTVVASAVYGTIREPVRAATSSIADLWRRTPDVVCWLPASATTTTSSIAYSRRAVRIYTPTSDRRVWVCAAGSNSTAVVVVRL